MTVRKTSGAASGDDHRDDTETVDVATHAVIAVDPAPPDTAPRGIAASRIAASGPLRLTWNLAGRDPADLLVADDGPAAVTPDWAWGGSAGAGVRVCVVDSGVEDGHPMVGRVVSSHAVAPLAAGGYEVVQAEPGDSYGHGTACASVVRRVAPGCEIHSVRVLGSGFGGTGDALLAGLRWAVREGFEVVNLSLSTTRPQFASALREIADEAFFRRTVIVASAHNTPVESFPWRFSSVISVGSHLEQDPELVLYNPAPPVEFFAYGQRVTVGWPGGTAKISTGNSFATPHVAGRCARILGKHPGLTPFQVKAVLYQTAHNVRGNHELDI